MCKSAKFALNRVSIRIFTPYGYTTFQKKFQTDAAASLIWLFLLLIGCFILILLISGIAIGVFITVRILRNKRQKPKPRYFSNFVSVMCGNFIIIQIIHDSFLLATTTNIFPI